MIRAMFTVSVVATLGAAQICAQDITSAPRGSLFGTGSSSSSRNNLDVTVALSQAYDTESPQELRSTIPQSGPQSGGYSSIFVAATDYARKSYRFDLDGTAATAARYYQHLDQVSVVTSNVAVGGTFRFAPRTTLDFTQDAQYAPSYLYQLFPAVSPPDVGESLPGAPDYRVDTTRSYSFNTRLNVSTGSPRQNRLELRAERNVTNFTGERQQSDLDILTAAGKWGHGLGRTGFLYTEYEYREGEFGFGSQTTEQRVRIGADWTPALSRTRRLTLHFSVAPSVIEIPESAINVTVVGAQYKAEADVSMEYPFLRSWSATGSYTRGVEYIAVLRQPVFRDAVRLAVSGLTTKRLDLGASAASSVGASALNQNSQRYDAYTGTARVRYAVSRSFALYGEYLYYYYRFHDLVGLAPGLPNRFEQHGIRAGLMLWARPVGR